MDLAGLERRVKRAAESHSNVRATVMELWNLVLDAYGPKEAEPGPVAQAPEIIGEPDDDTLVPDPE